MGFKTNSNAATDTRKQATAWQTDTGAGAATRTATQTAPGANKAVVCLTTMDASGEGDANLLTREEDV